MASVSLGRRIGLIVAVLALVGQAWISLSGGLSRLSGAQGWARWSQTTVELAAGLVSIAGLAVTYWRRRWGVRLMLLWAVLVALATGPSSVVWGRASEGVGLLVAVLTLLLALGVVWLWRWALAA